MEDNISPEERLLRLIRRGSKRPAPEKESTAANLKPEQPQSEASPQPRTKPEVKKFSLPPLPSAEQVNRLLLLLLLVLAVYLLTEFLIKMPRRIEKGILALGAESRAVLEIPLAAKTEIEPVSYYTEAVKTRNLFTVTTPDASKDKPSASFREMLAKLRLQGIVSEPNPQAIIEDTKTRQVYFLSPGDFIGEIELKEILPGKVRLGYYGQEAELSL